MTLIESEPHLELTLEVSALSSKTPLPRNTAPEVVGLARTQPKWCLPTGASFKSAPVSPRSNLEESPSFLKQRQRGKKDLDKKRDKYPESASLGWRRTQHRCSQTARHRFRREEAAARTLPVRALGPRGQPGPAAACRPRRVRPGDDGPQGTSPQASEGRNASHADPGLGRTRLVIALAESISTSIPFISRSVSFNWYQNKQARDPGSLPADHPASRDPPPTHTHTPSIRKDRACWPCLPVVAMVTAYTVMEKQCRPPKKRAYIH